MASKQLERAIALGAAAAARGFDWETAADALLKVPEESQELSEAIVAHEGILDELGDLLFAVANVSRKLGLDPEVALEHANDKFQRRFEGVVQTLESHGRRPEDATLDEMEAIWADVKAAE